VGGAADRGEVGDVGSAAVAPRQDVVEVGQADRAGTRGVGGREVAGPDRLAQPPRRLVGRAADPDDLAAVVQHDQPQIRAPLVEQPAGQRRGHLHAAAGKPGEQRPGDPVTEQGGQIDDHERGRPGGADVSVSGHPGEIAFGPPEQLVGARFAAGLGTPAAGPGTLERIRPVTVGLAVEVVCRRGGSRQVRVQCFGQRGEVLRAELAVQRPAAEQPRHQRDELAPLRGLLGAFELPVPQPSHVLGHRDDQVVRGVGAVLVEHVGQLPVQVLPLHPAQRLDLVDDPHDLRPRHPTVGQCLRERGHVAQHLDREQQQVAIHPGLPRDLRQPQIHRQPRDLLGQPVTHDLAQHGHHPGHDRVDVTQQTRQLGQPRDTPIHPDDHLQRRRGEGGSGGRGHAREARAGVRHLDPQFPSATEIWGNRPVTAGGEERSSPRRRRRPPGTGRAGQWRRSRRRALRGVHRR
jgi:hypothetical protein